MYNRLRPLKRQILVLCLLTIGTIWFHQSTSIQIIGSVYQTGKFSHRLGIVYEWIKDYSQQPQIYDHHHHRDHDSDKNHQPSTIVHSSTSVHHLRTTKMKKIEARTTTEQSLETWTNNTNEAHPFENFCQYPILIPEDESLSHVIKHTRLHICKQVQIEILTFDYDRGELIFNRTLAERLFPKRKPRCQYRAFTGGIRPRITDYQPIGEWISVDKEITKIETDLIETHCYAQMKPHPNAPKYQAGKIKENPIREEEIFRNAFGHIAKRNETASKDQPRPYIKNNETILNIDFLFLDSTAYNMMQRHMPKTWRYMKDVMGFYHLEGYTKVGDNSMVNIMPILAGLRYGTQSDDMQTEVLVDHPMDVEPWPFLWKFFRERGCATMFNDDIADYTRGFLNYPWTHVKGFAEYPTDHFIRPWHIYHRRFPIQDSSKFCFGNKMYTQLQLHFWEQMIKKYKDTCHFSFNFITDLPHDDPNNLELADDDLHARLERLYTGDYLNNTILFVMGDHGNRIGYIMYTYVGRIEERMTLFSVYIPEWYRRKYPEAMRQLEINKHRLTSNYDVYRMINEIFNNTLNQTEEPPIDQNRAASKGISLFRPIPTNRTCTDANVPPQHCICLEPVQPWAASSTMTPNDTLYQWAKDVLFNWTRQQLQMEKLCQNVDQIDILSIKALTTNQMIQHGVRDQSLEQMKKISRRLDGEIEYFDTIYHMSPMNLTARVRLQYHKRPIKRNLFVLVPPRNYYSNEENSYTRSSWIEEMKNCKGNRQLTLNDLQKIPWFCRCAAKT